ncbi:MAG: hypothetical protein EOP45_09475 [Sphingobacteriaceae bacterium]|nr:MAG: hypothetical protein EOP45_09475 [Sphingobacteriaceae bacterium]
MKNFLCSLLLLWFCCTHTTTAQNLTARQLLDLNKMEQMQKDDYLTKRGWKFAKTEQQGDSTYKVFWEFNNTKGVAIAQACMWQQIGQREAFSYSTILRAPFDGIRTAVLAVPMELIGTNNTEAMQTFYRDASYDVILTIRNREGRTEYSAYFQPHDYVKAYTVGPDGKMEPEWIVRPHMTSAQKQHYDALADSLEQATEAIRAQYQKKPATLLKPTTSKRK